LHGELATREESDVQQLGQTSPFKPVEAWRLQKMLEHHGLDGAWDFSDPERPALSRTCRCGETFTLDFPDGVRPVVLLFAPTVCSECSAAAA
jgi:hypothetical protein